MFTRNNSDKLTIIGILLSIILLCVCFPLNIQAHGLKYHDFTHINRQQGMNASGVYCIISDKQGLIWMGTDHGLYSFDGYQALHYNSRTPFNDNSEGVIYCALMIDSVHLWLGADNGLCIFNTYTDKYEASPAGLPKNIRAISRINDHLFWIGSLNGLYKFDACTQKAIKITDAALPNQAVYSILKYDENTYFFGTYNGLCKYNVPDNKFSTLNSGLGSNNSNMLVLSILPDYIHNCLWVGLEGGLFKLDPATLKSTPIPYFKGNSVKSLLLDNQNCLWTGTDNGLYIYEPVSGKYQAIRHDALNDHSLANNVIWTIFEDKKQNIWIGTDAGTSLYTYNPTYKTQTLSELTGSNEGNQIISLLADSKGNIWLGGSNGLIKVEKSTAKTVWFQQNNKEHPLPHNKVRCIFEDSEGDIWIATDGSICLFNSKTEQFTRYQIEDKTHARNANWAYAICEDETKKIWVATCLGGLFVIDKKQLIASQKKTYIAEKNYFYNNGTGLSGTMLQFLVKDRDNNIWAGTYKAGLNKIDRLNQKIIQITTHSKGLKIPSDEVTAMTIDSENFLWLGLRNRLLKINIKNQTYQIVSDPRLTDSYINALTDDGKYMWLSLSTGLFYIDKITLTLKQINSENSYYTPICPDNYSHKIIAGGVNEFAEFDPENVLSEEKGNSLFMTSLRINDKLTSTDSALNVCNLKQSIRFTHNLDLKYTQNCLSFTFSELNFNQQQGVRYAYKLNSLDADWHYLENGGNRITYNNLPPGDYILTLSRIGSSGTPLPNPYTLEIKVRHPWYSTPPAKLTYFIIAVLLIGVFANYFLILNRLRFERMDKIKTMELTAHKIDFLTNISHELKTPLSLIISPLSKIIEQTKPAQLKEQLAEVRQNALKMGNLIHQLMEASRNDTTGLSLIKSRADLIIFINSVASVFENSLADKGIQIKIQSEYSSLFIEADLLKLEIILTNLLSNASKFAPSNSTIFIKVKKAEDQVQIAISDEGPGIAPSDLPHVFERFYQSRHSLVQNKEGTGIGLSIVKEYVQLHKGTVKIISDGIKGTCVEISLPLKQDSQDPEIADQMNIESSPVQNSTKTKLLIVEDNTEILRFISDNLSDKFQCIKATNGKLGLEAALTYLPDIVVTDIMMPVMDGIEMCRKIKDNIHTARIPVVMLTAKDDKDTELLGYRMGVDAFISKPFEIDYLSERLLNLLNGRSLLVQKARQEAILEPQKVEIVSSDEKLLATITQIIESEITNPDLSVTILSEKSGYSLKQIYRRIKALTGQTAVDYIRSVRLKKAAFLMSKKTFTVAEIMYMVGFSNHSYFAKRFQEMYGKSPRQFMEEV